MLEFINVSKSFGKRVVLENISFQLKDNRTLAVLGPSGVGKTTVLRIAAGTIRPDAGEVRSDRQKTGFVFQEPRLLPWRTALANVTLVLKNNKTITDRESNEKAAAMLKKLGLQGFEQYYPAQLSGGMRQRVAIARAFVLEPDLLLLDEPFSGLDPGLKNSLQQMLSELLAWHPAEIIHVTHEPQDAVILADTAIVLAGVPGKIMARLELDRPKEKRDHPYLQEQAAKLTAMLKNCVTP